MKVPAEALGCSLASRRGDLSGLSKDKHPARNAFAGAERFIHHIQWLYRFGVLSACPHFCRHFLRVRKRYDRMLFSSTCSRLAGRTLLTLPLVSSHLST